MFTSYIDECGNAETFGSSPSASPLFVVTAVIIELGRELGVLNDLLALKREIYGGARSRTGLVVMKEVKGATVREGLSHRRESVKHGRAYAFLDGFLTILEDHSARVVGSVKIKERNFLFPEEAAYLASTSACARDFHHLLESEDDCGTMIMDARYPSKDRRLQEGVFNERYHVDVASGDLFDASPRLIPALAFQSSSHSPGLQVADIVASAIIFPLAIAAFHGSSNGVVSKPFIRLRDQIGPRLERLQYRYRVEGRRPRGGIVANDVHGRLDTRKLFGH